MGIKDDSFIHTISIYFPSIFHNFRPLGLVEDASKEHWAVDLVVVVVEEGLASQQNCGVSAWISGRWDHHGPPHGRLLGFLLWLTLGTADGCFPASTEKRWQNFPSAGLRMIYLDLSWSFMIIHDLSWSIMIIHDLSRVNHHQFTLPLPWLQVWHWAKCSIPSPGLCSLWSGVAGGERPVNTNWNKISNGWTTLNSRLTHVVPIIDPNKNTYHDHSLWLFVVSCGVMWCRL